MKIQPIQIGLPIQTATYLLIRVISFDIDAITANTYYELQDDTGKMIINGNYQLTEEQFAQWASDNSFISDIVLSYLGLTQFTE